MSTTPTELAEAIARHRPRKPGPGGHCDACTMLAEVDRLRAALDAAWKAAAVPVRGMVSLAEVVADLRAKRDEFMDASKRCDRTITGDQEETYTCGLVAGHIGEHVDRHGCARWSNNDDPAAAREALGR
jgi:hypothetical protein